MQVDIVIDTVCPWCYVGKARFDRALAEWSGEDVEIGWRPFQLNPHLAAEGKDRAIYLADKFGDTQRAEQLYRTIHEAGAKEDIEFRFERIRRTPNSVDSHRLIAHAGEAGRQTEMVDALFRAFFTDGRDIGDAATLADIAAGLGFAHAETLDYLRSDRDRERILAEDDSARRLGVNGVPCYIVDRKYAVSGAQSPEVFLQIFRLASQDAAHVAAE